MSARSPDDPARATAGEDLDDREEHRPTGRGAAARCAPDLDRNCRHAGWNWSRSSGVGLTSATGGEEIMNWDQMKGNWKQFQGKVQQQWGKLTDDDLSVVEGNRKELVGRIQERYGIAREEAERQVKDWETRQ
jgi:uncharacterized protein YjbJ (UPF0337 family)